MKKIDAIKSEIKKLGGIVKTEQLNSIGISNSEVAKLCNDSILYKIKHGYYCLNEDNISDEQIISTLLGDATICLNSALFYYGYSDFTPREWHIAVERGYSRSRLKIDALSIKTKFIQSELYELGKTKALINGYTLNIYDRERTICDCFKYRNKLDNEMFNKAINAYIADEKKNLVNLSKYAKKMGVYSKMINIMEVLLNA